MLIGTLNVFCNNYEDRSQGPNGKRRTMTKMAVRMGETIIATRTTFGPWTPHAALIEFKRFPNKFQPFGKWTEEQVKAVAA